MLTIFAKAMRVTVSQFSLRNCIADNRRLHHSHIVTGFRPTRVLWCSILERLLSSLSSNPSRQRVFHQIQPTQIPSSHECISMIIISV